MASVTAVRSCSLRAAFYRHGTDTLFAATIHTTQTTQKPGNTQQQYFTNKDPDNLSMSGSYNENGDGLTEWYKTTPGVECYVGDKALKIDRDAKTVISESGRVSVKTFLESSVGILNFPSGISHKLRGQH